MLSFCLSRNLNYLVFAFAAIRFPVTVPSLRNASALQAAELISLATWETAAVGLVLAVLAVHKGVAHLGLSRRTRMMMMVRMVMMMVMMMMVRMMMMMVIS